MDRVIEKLNAAAAPGPDRVMAGAVLAAATAKGDTFIRAFGTTTVHDDAPLLRTDSVMWLASVTKLLTTVAALQCVEKGFFELDAPISRILPAWANPDILTGFDDATGKPVLQKATKAITLRHLLTHTSGMALEQAHPVLAKWRRWAQGKPGDGGFQSVAEGGSMMELMAAGFSDPVDDLDVPLVYEPGDGWSYAGGLDVAARMIEQATGFTRFEDYMAEHICKPLAMKSTTFHPAQRAGLAVAPLTVKLPNNQLTSDIPLSFPNHDPKHDGGGSGLFSTAEDYLRLLTSLLLNDGRILHRDTVTAMFEPQLSNNEFLSANLAVPEFGRLMVPGMPVNRDWNWGLGGILAMDGIPDRASESCMWWCGIANGQWWIDQHAGTCGIILTHLIPPGDERTSALFGEFQNAVHAGMLVDID
ncbi:beta-lactamase [Exophiala aquamarina CBS 119918]|uniref:Beta-lactamase n=1 Tax=Exophiala aquamarina CBS 119918 TaxID=1182545 RepID=A0A072P4T7_9EURO|nr:beta-lactamase [Exophiala aquamarina CBS 119918]KEF54846.1 beta-lactamase [Exophiala aquamarina CBS 119918]